MSHYCVAVFSDNGEDFEELLAPYNEMDKKYCVFTPLLPGALEALRVRFENIQRDNANNLGWYETSFDWWMKNRGYYENDGVWGYDNNPNGKWDWYSLNGGSWKFNLKDDRPAWDGVAYRKNQFDYYSEDGDLLSPYAFITPDGKWHAPGTVVWFAMDDSTDESREAFKAEWKAFIDSPENPYVNFVDCHI